MPFGINPITDNVYYNNLRREDDVLIPYLRDEAHDHQRSLRRDDFLPVVQSQLPVDFPTDALRLVVYEGGTPNGRRVRCVPHWVRNKPRKLDDPPPPGWCRNEAAAGHGIECDRAYVSFLGLPEGLYDLAFEYPVTAETVLMPGPVLYTALSPTPFAFVDLFVEDDEHAHSYVIDLERRDTWWRYFVVPRDEDLAVVSANERRVGFHRPKRVDLPDGTKALRFTARRRLPLQQRPEHRFALVRRGDDGRARRHDVVAELPSPTGREAVPTIDANRRRRIYSDMYVYL